MSKLSKLFRRPGAFFVDAARNRHSARVGRVPLVEPEHDPADTRTPTYVIGFSPWKQFLRGWFPERKLIFLPKTLEKGEFEKVWQKKLLAERRAELFVWGFKVEPFVLNFAKANAIPCIYVEDGFIRSIGLGATKTPPFSLTLDRQTPYFDASQPSDLEDILNTYDFDADELLLERADRLMALLLQTGLSKYNHAAPTEMEALYGPKVAKRILVVGQVEDDASIKYGCARAYTNNDAVMIAVMENPGAQIIYKPHPDVLNGHRPKLSKPEDVMHLCRVLEHDVSLAQSFETIDHVYTITSQAGLEALLRGLKVTTLGSPFYAGWGLTEDRQPNARRTRTLSLRQVFAAAYLLYPRYFDPIYKVPLSAEQAVERLLQLKKLAPPHRAAAQADALACPPAGGVPAPPTVGTQPAMDGAFVAAELAALRGQISDLQARVHRGSLQDSIAELCINLHTLGAEVTQLRSTLECQRAH